MSKKETNTCSSQQRTCVCAHMQNPVVPEQAQFSPVVLVKDFTTLILTSLCPSLQFILCVSESDYFDVKVLQLPQSGPRFLPSWTLQLA